MLLVSCTALLWLALAGPAAAQDTVPGDNSGVDQYSESLPSSDGRRAPAVGARPVQGVPLSRRVESSLPGGQHGRLLRRVATDPTLGAPVRRKGRTAGLGTAPADSGTSAASAIGGTLFGSSGIWLLLLVMLLSAVAAVAGAAARRRSS